jgi:hypothetical protein
MGLARVRAFQARMVNKGRVGPDSLLDVRSERRDPNGNSISHGI